MPVTTKLITYEESLTIPENKLEEIVDGESRIMPLPTEGHWDLLRCLAETLSDQLPSREFVVDTGPVGVGIKRRPVLMYRAPHLEKLLRDYESIGVPEVWFIDPRKELSTLYVFENGRLQIKESLQTGMLRSATLPVTVDIAELWQAFGA